MHTCPNDKQNILYAYHSMPRALPSLGYQRIENIKFQELSTNKIFVIPYIWFI